MNCGIEELNEIDLCVVEESVVWWPEVEEE